MTYGIVSDGTLPTPEPSTLALLGAGAISLFAYAWRRRRAVQGKPSKSTSEANEPSSFGLALFVGRNKDTA